MTTTVDVFTSSVDAETWEPLIEDGEQIGEVHWLVQAEGRPVAGMWRDEPEEGAELPYKVTGSDAFHVIRGEAELETPDGERIKLVAGGLYSFPDGFTAIWRTKSSFLKFFVIG
jgi:uncharacterized cupin superfamily protein